MEPRHYGGVFVLQKKTVTFVTVFFGAGKGSRTLLSSLGSSRSTDELYLHFLIIIAHLFQKIKGILQKSFIFTNFYFVLESLQSAIVDFCRILCYDKSCTIKYIQQGDCL